MYVTESMYKHTGFFYNYEYQKRTPSNFAWIEKLPMAILNPCMKFKSSFGQKTSFEALRWWHSQKNIANMSQDPPNPGSSSVKVENWDFL